MDCIESRQCDTFTQRVCVASKHEFVSEGNIRRLGGKLATENLSMHQEAHMSWYTFFVHGVARCSSGCLLTGRGTLVLPVSCSLCVACMYASYCSPAAPCSSSELANMNTVDAANDSHTQNNHFNIAIVTSNLFYYDI